MSALALIVCVCVCVCEGVMVCVCVCMRWVSGQSHEVGFLTNSKIRVKILGIPQLILYPVCVCGCVDVCVWRGGGGPSPIVPSLAGFLASFAI